MQQTTDKKPTIAALQAQVDELQAALKQTREAVGSLGRRNDELQKLLTGAGQENDQLRDQLHSQTVTIARLEGYRDRVLEFDPVTERQVYLDEGGELAMDEHRGAPPSFVTRRRRGRHSFVDEGINTASGGTPWYRRRG